MKITIASDIRKLQVNLPDTATTFELERKLFAEINTAVESEYTISPPLTKKYKKPELEKPEASVPTETLEAYVPAETPEEKTPEPKEYWGLLRIVCPNCGDIHEFGVKRENSISHYRCEKCGEIYDFGSEMELVPVKVYCPNCNNACTIRTNDTGNQINLTCVSCKSNIDAFWNEKKHRYETPEYN